MFRSDFVKFKESVEKTIWDFFHLTPEQLEPQMFLIERMNPEVDFHKPVIREYGREGRSAWYTWATMKYFLNVYNKCTEMMECLSGDDIFEEIDNDHK